MNATATKQITSVIYLTKEEATLFVEFQKQFALIQLLNNIGAFDIKSGSITLHFDSMGRIGSVDKQQHYKP